MLTRILLALFTLATFHLGHSTSPGGREHGHVPEALERHWEQAHGRAGPREGCWSGIPCQILRRELMHEKTPQWGEASKESLQEWFCHREKLKSFPLALLWDESSAWPELGRVKGSGGRSPRHNAQGICVWFAVGWGMTCAKRAQRHMGMEQPQERILHSSNLATGPNAFRFFFPTVLGFTRLPKLVNSHGIWFWDAR